MGVRLLRARLQDPLTDVEAVTRRLDSIEVLLADRDVRRHLRDALAGMRDLERLVARCVQRHRDATRPGRRARRLRGARGDRRRG